MKGIIAMIHKFSRNGTNIVADVYSGAVHVVSDVVYDLLDYITEDSRELTDDIVEKLSSKYAESDIREAYDEICFLIEKDALFSKDFYSGVVKHWNKKSVVKALCLHITHDCNMRCKYCFADTGEYGGKRSFMSSEVGKKAIDFVIEKSEDRKNIEIDFFGGEPLMNFGVVKDIVEYAKGRAEETGKIFRFTITTNGLMLNDEIAEYINANMGNVVLSIDGRKDKHDFMRPKVGGQGTYDEILPKYKKIADSRNQDNYYVRGTFTSNNLDFSEDVIHLADEGFEQISVEPVVLPDSHEFALKEEHLPKLYSEYDKLADEYLKRKKNGKGFNFFHFMIDFSQGPCVYKRLSGCGAGHEYVAITPEGDIYPCHQFVGNEPFKMGNVFDGDMDTSIRDKFMNSNVYTKEKCADCWAKFYCSGGCSANAHNFNGDIDKPYELACDLEKKRVECAMYIAANK